MSSRVDVLSLVVAAASGWNAAVFHRAAAAAPPHDIHRAARTARPVMGPPSGLVDNFLVKGYENKTEVEQIFGVSISSDESLWDENDFVAYLGEKEWVQKKVEQVVMLFTYVALNSFAKLRVAMRGE